MDYDETVDDDDIRNQVVVSAHTSTARFDFEDGDQVVMMEVRAFTADGKEHHLLWPVDAALPLLQAIMHAALAEKGSDGPRDAEVPDTLPEGWSDE